VVGDSTKFIFETNSIFAVHSVDCHCNCSSARRYHQNACDEEAIYCHPNIQPP